VEHNLVSDIAVCVIAAWLVAVVGQTARQPPQQDYPPFEK
jgi:hypothetical protein